MKIVVEKLLRAAILFLCVMTASAWAVAPDPIDFGSTVERGD